MTTPVDADQTAPLPERWRTLEYLFDAIAVVNRKCAISYANDRFRRLAHLPSQAHVVAQAGTVTLTDMLELPAVCWDVLKEEQTYLVPQVHSVPFGFTSGAKGFAQVSIDSLPAQPGETEPLYLCVMRDITLEMQNKWLLDEKERVILDLTRGHAEAQFLWRLSLETPIYVEPPVVFATVSRRLREELGFADACFLQTPDDESSFPEPFAGDHRVGSRLREVANSVTPTILRKQSRNEVWPIEYGFFGHFWVVNFRPKMEKPFFLLARSDDSAPGNSKESNRRPFLDALAIQITTWLDNRSLYISSITDGLTGLFNRRHFDSRFAIECLLARERKTMISLILIDIDFFKKINDSFGHQVGDSVLKIMGAVLKDVLRTTDIAARVGGEEFGVLLFDTSPADAAKAAEKIRMRIANTPIPLPGFEQTIHITVSCGIAGFLGLTQTSESVYGAADEALYLAKTNGRNRTEVNSNMPFALAG